MMRILTRFALCLILVDVGAAQPAPDPVVELDPSTDELVTDLRVETVRRGELSLPDHVARGLASFPDNLSATQVTISVESAPWLRLRFASPDSTLDAGEILIVRSGECQQTFTASTLRQWNGKTMAFNGGKVDVLLLKQRGVTLDQFVDLIDGVIIPAPPTAVVPLISLCGDGDNRIPSDDPRVGRTMPIKCSAFIIGDENVFEGGANMFLSADHCLGLNGDYFDILEFTDSNSVSHNTPTRAACEDQYLIRRKDVRSNDARFGNDWVVFSVFPNTETNQLPIQRQGDFFSIETGANEPGYEPPTHVIVTGYGLDLGALQDLYAQQTDSGELLEPLIAGENDVALRYRVDTAGGNSGSPVIAESDGVAIGIHTGEGCGIDESTGNHGTSFQNQSLLDAINSFDPEG